MPASKAQQKAVSKYMKENYDEIKIRMGKGKKETIQATAAAVGESVNAYINTAITQRMEHDSGGTASEIAQRPAETPQGAGAVSLPAETLETAQRAAKRTGESVAAFVARAVADQEKRDDKAFKLGINPA